MLLRRKSSAMFSLGFLKGVLDPLTHNNSEFITCFIYYKQAHPPSRCINVTDVERRITILRRNGRCFMCL